MTTYDEAWVKAEEAKRQWLHDNGLYKQDDEHASCGVGLVVSISGKPSRKVVENGINALKAIWHRGRRGRRWQDGRWRGHPCTDPGQVLLRCRAPHRPRTRHEQTCGRGSGLPAPHRLWRTGTLPVHRRNRSPAHGPLYLWLASRPCEHRRAGRKGQRHPPGNRTDPHTAATRTSTPKPLSGNCTSSAAASKKRPSRHRFRASISARCPAAASSTRA